jgi:hypothetical protein
MPRKGDKVLTIGTRVMVNAQHPLDAEIAAFERKKADLEKTYPGKWVVFKGADLVGAWDTINAAAAEAVVRFGRGPYLIRQVGAPPPTLPASVLFREPANV